MSMRPWSAGKTTTVFEVDAIEEAAELLVAEGDHAVVQALAAIEVGGGHLAGVEADDRFGGTLLGGGFIGHFAFATAGRGDQRGGGGDGS